MSTAEDTRQILERLDKLEAKVFGTVPPVEPPIPPVQPGDCGPNPDPNNTHVKPGGWGGDTAAPSAWVAVSMTDDPTLWKVVDKAGKNIAHRFTSEAEANAYVKYHQCIIEGGDPDPDPGIPPQPTPTPTPSTGDCNTGPYLVIGQAMQSTQRGPTTRHYASGKPDDKTIEKNVKNIPFKNYQFVVYVTMNSIEHDDTLSLKFGGTHMGSGWFDTGVGFEDGECCLGTEKKHPSTSLCQVKGPKIGSVLSKKLGIAGVYFKDTNKIELWTDFQGSGWKKQVEGANVGNFNPQSDVDEAQLRIDGFEDLPTIHCAQVTQIAAAP